MSLENSFILTFDVDWAADPVINYVYEELKRYNVKSTWFHTHRSPAVDKILLDSRLIESGIHPNFLPGSSHGSTPDEVLRFVKEIVPNAISSRSHAVVQSGPILNKLAEEVRIDSSIFLPEMPGIQTVTHLGINKKLLRVPFFWADDYELCKDSPQWSIDRMTKKGGIKVILFHPIHIFLDSQSVAYYEHKKKEGFPKSPVSRADNCSGVGKIFANFLKYLSGKPTFFLKDFLNQPL